MGVNVFKYYDNSGYGEPRGFLGKLFTGFTNGIVSSTGAYGYGSSYNTCGYGPNLFSCGFGGQSTESACGDILANVAGGFAEAKLESLLTSSDENESAETTLKTAKEKVDKLTSELNDLITKGEDKFVEESQTVISAKTAADTANTNFENAKKDLEDAQAETSPDATKIARLQEKYNAAEKAKKANDEALNSAKEAAKTAYGEAITKKETALEAAKTAYEDAAKKINTDTKRKCNNLEDYKKIGNDGVTKDNLKQQVAAFLYEFNRFSNLSGDEKKTMAESAIKRYEGVASGEKTQQGLSAFTNISNDIKLKYDIMKSYIDNNGTKVPFGQ